MAVFKIILEAKRPVRKPRKRRMDEDENNPRKMGVRGWGKIARDRDVWT
jgi:hypothetical protein